MTEVIGTKLGYDDFVKKMCGIYEQFQEGLVREARIISEVIYQAVYNGIYGGNMKRYEVRLTNKMNPEQYAIKDTEKDCIILGRNEVIDELNSLNLKNKELQEEIAELEEICDEYSKFRIFLPEKINRIYDILTRGDI